MPIGTAQLRFALKYVLLYTLKDVSISPKGKKMSWLQKGVEACNVNSSDDTLLVPFSVMICMQHANARLPKSNNCSSIL